MEDLLYAYLQHSKVYYANSSEHANMKTVLKPMTELYADTLVRNFGVTEYKAIRAWWQKDTTRTRQYVNKQMKRTHASHQVGCRRRPDVTSHAHGPEVHRNTPPRPLRHARSSTSPPASHTALVESTLPLLTKGRCRHDPIPVSHRLPAGEVCKIKSRMVDRSGDVWQIELEEHKTAYRGRQRTILCWAKAKAILAPYSSEQLTSIASAQRRAKHRGSKPGTPHERRLSHAATSVAQTSARQASKKARRVLHH